MLNRATFLAALPFAGAALPALAQTSPAIRVGANPNDPYAQPYYALDGGFFGKAGLSVDIQTFPNGGPIVTGVASGALDVGMSNPTQLANAVEHGVPFVLFAGSALYNSTAPTSAICVAATSAIRDVKDLAGKTIALSSLRDSLNMATDELLQKGGVDPNGVKFIEIPFGEMGGALARGAVQAAVMVEPALTIAVDSGDVRVLAHPFDAIGTRLLASGWFTTLDWYRKNTALAKGMAAAIYASANWANKNHDATAKILQNHSKLSPEVAKKMVRVEFAESLEPRLIDPLLVVGARLKMTNRLIRSNEMIAG
jgi:NitT/TauT family transport system substrate-binding protein